MSLSQIELVWVRVRLEGECIWVNPRKDNNVSEFHRCQCLNPTWHELKMVAIQDGHQHSLENEWGKFFFCANGGEGNVSEVCFCANGGNQSWQVCVSLKGQTKMADSKMAKSKMAEFKIAVIMKLSENEWVKVFLCKWWEPILASVCEFERTNWDGRFQDGQIQDGRNQNGCHNQVEWEWMSLNQIELVWVRVRMEGECFWVNPREDKQGVWIPTLQNLKPRWWNSRWQNSWWPPSIKLSKNEWVWVRLN